ncbi:MAG TPA: SDR family NAD(P)-dependent oxidoreductase [Kofleriaceae bacterium]|nr:SDR family NAD(P)-dependent oxidoreductase [Kofleriaceae bacterium]
MTLPKLLEGKVAAITGSGGGIGRAHALLFARHGARVVVNDVGGARDGTGGDRAMADRVVSEIREAGGEAVADHGDVSEPEGADGLVRRAVESFGQLDVLVNNAGILRDKTLRKMTLEQWDAVIKVHLRGTFLCTQAAARHLMDRGAPGRIVNTTSVSGLKGNFGQANYAAAKAGIVGFTLTCALELEKYNITVNAIAPIAHTRMTEDLPMMSAMPDAAELLAAERIAPAALFLASDRAADITGTVLAVEGARMYVYRMSQTPAVLPADPATGWTAEEIDARWVELAGSR